MKKPLILSFICLMCIYCANVQAQTSKTGYLSVEKVMMYMPELPVARSEMEDFETKVNSQIQVKYEALQSKIADYQPIAESLSQQKRLELEKEIQDMDRNLQKYRGEAQQAAADKEGKLMAPIYKRIQEAIDAVAKTEGYEQVFRAETMLYTGNSEDIFELVIKELDIELPEDVK